MSQDFAGGQECPPSGQESGHSCPPSELTSEEVPINWFFDEDAETDIHRHRLPHWQQGGAWCFVTWRLADSLPQGKLREWKAEKERWLKTHPKPWDRATFAEFKKFGQQIDAWLDSGMGECMLRKAELAKIVGDALRHFDGARYKMAAFVVMPNHAHLLFQPLPPHCLKDILKSWKGYTAWRINKHLGRSGTLWQEDYWDRLVRDERHFMACVDYIARNPEQAHLSDGEFLLYIDPIFAPEGGHFCPPGV